MVVLSDTSVRLLMNESNRRRLSINHLINQSINRVRPFDAAWSVRQIISPSLMMNTNPRNLTGENLLVPK